MHATVLSVGDDSSASSTPGTEINLLSEDLDISVLPNAKMIVESEVGPLCDMGEVSIIFAADMIEVISIFRHQSESSKPG